MLSHPDDELEHEQYSELRFSSDFLLPCRQVECLKTQVTADLRKIDTDFPSQNSNSSLVY